MIGFANRRRRGARSSNRPSCARCSENYRFKQAGGGAGRLEMRALEMRAVGHQRRSGATSSVANAAKMRSNKPCRAFERSSCGAWPVGALCLFLLKPVTNDIGVHADYTAAPDARLPT